MRNSTDDEGRLSLAVARAFVVLASLVRSRSMTVGADDLAFLYFRKQPVFAPIQADDLSHFDQFVAAFTMIQIHHIIRKPSAAIRTRFLFSLPYDRA